MSTTLYWRVSRPFERTSVNYELKRLLVERYLPSADSFTLWPGALDFLDGVTAASSEDLTRNNVIAIAEAIREHGGVVIWLES